MNSWRWSRSPASHGMVSEVGEDTHLSNERIVMPSLPPGADKPVETVNHPAHYNQYQGLEIIDLVEQMNFNRGNAVKYIARAGFKSPEKELEDLKKANWYITREIERMEKRNA